MRGKRNSIIAALLLSAGAMATWIGKSDAETKIIQGVECRRAVYEAVSIIGTGTTDDPWRPPIVDDFTGPGQTHEYSFDREKRVIVVWAEQSRHDVLKDKHKRLDE